MKRWTIGVNGTIACIDMLRLLIFATKKECAAYIKETYPPSLISLGKIKPLQITIDVV